MNSPAAESVCQSVPLARRVVHQLRSSGRAQLRDLNVDEQAGTVTLSGRLPTFYMKQLAQELAFSVQGVREIRNETVVCVQ